MSISNIFRKLPKETYKQYLPFEIRTETGEIKTYQTFKRAYESAREYNAWKIAFGDYRWIRKTWCNKWQPFEELKLLRISPKYVKFANDPNVLFWVWQKAIADNWEEIYAQTDLTNEEKQEKERVECIVEVITDAELYERFRDYQPNS